MNFLHPYTQPQELGRFPFSLPSFCINVFVIRSSLRIPIIVNLSSIYPLVTVGTYREKLGPVYMGSVEANQTPSESDRVEKHPGYICVYMKKVFRVIGY